MTGIGFTSEKRDVNVGDLEEKVYKELKDVTRHSLNADLKYYDSGVKWEKEELDIKGKQWISAYLPVWLYSYQDIRKILHYVAVNGRTGEVMGSIPMNKKKLFFKALNGFLGLFFSFLSKPAPPDCCNLSWTVAHFSALDRR